MPMERDGAEAAEGSRTSSRDEPPQDATTGNCRRVGRRRLLASAGMGLAALPGCGGLDIGGADRTPTVNPELRGTPTPSPEIEWTARLGSVERILGRGDRLVIGVTTDDGPQIMAVGPATGEVRWRKPVDGRPLFVLPGPEVVLQVKEGSEPEIIAREAADGSVRWRLEQPRLPFPVWWGEERAVFRLLGLSEPKIFGVGLATGETGWERSVLSLTRVTDEGLIVRVMSDTDGTVTLANLAPRTGESKWENRIGIETDGTEEPVAEVVDGTVVLVGTAGVATGVDLDSGARLFRTPIDAPIGAVGHVTTDTEVYFGTPNAGDATAALVKLDAAAGNVAWTTTLSTRGVRPLRAGGTLYTAARTVNGTTVAARDPATGEAQWRANGTPVTPQSPRLVSRDGRIRALSPAGEQRWTVTPDVDARVRADRSDLIPLGSPDVWVSADSVTIVGRRGVVSYDRETGDERTRATTLGPVRRDPSTVIDGTAYLTTDTGLIAVDV